MSFQFSRRQLLRGMVGGAVSMGKLADLKKFDEIFTRVYQG